MNKLLHKTLAGYIVTYMLIFVITIIALVPPIYKIAYNSSRDVIVENISNNLDAKVEQLADQIRRTESVVVTEDTLRDMILPSLPADMWMRISAKGDNIIYENGDSTMQDCTVKTFTDSHGLITLEAGIPNYIFAQSVKDVQQTILIYCLVAFAAAIILSIVMAHKLYRPIDEYIHFAEKQNWLDDTNDVMNLRDCIRESTLRFSINSRQLSQNIEQMRTQYRNAILLGHYKNDVNITISQLKSCFDGIEAVKGSYVSVRFSVCSSNLKDLNNIRRCYQRMAELIRREFVTYCIESPDYLIIVRVDTPELDSFDEKLESICAEAVGERENLDMVRIARSSMHSGLDELRRACDESGTMVLNVRPFMNVNSNVLRYEVHDDMQGEDALPSLITYNKSLLNVLLSGNEQALTEQMKELCSRFAEIYLTHNAFAPAFYYNILSAIDMGRQRLNVDDVDDIEIKDYDSTQKVDAIFDYLYEMAHKICLKVREQPSKQDSADKIIDFMREHYCENAMCLSMLSEEFKLSEAYISRMIKLKTGRTYTEYLEQLRMNRAEMLLCKNDLSINDVALELGYETPNTFFKAFKRVYHVSPGTYRENMLKNDAIKSDELE